MQPFENRLGLLLKTLRENAGLTQDHLAWKAEISRSYLQNLERGRNSDLKISTLTRLCRSLGLESSDFLRRLEGNSPEPRADLKDATANGGAEGSTADLKLGVLRNFTNGKGGGA